MEIKLFGMKAELKKEVIAVLIIVGLFLAGVAGYLIVKSNKDIIIDSKSANAEVGKESTLESSEKTAASTESTVAEDSEAEEKKEVEEIRVYVTGCVKKQGIVTLEKGQLIDDAIRLAGGATKEADLGSINLVYKLEENTMLYIKSKKEVTKAAQSATEAGEAGAGVNIVKDSGGAVVNEQQKSASTGGKININNATADELDTLPGIGEATAQDILAYRQSNGSFKTIQDIMKVPRIKESRFARIKDFITVD